MTRYQLCSREEILAKKRAITEARLEYARSIKDVALIRTNEKQLARIARWEEEA